MLKLEGFEGPLDLLLELARAQKVDLAKISILSLVEQYPRGDRGRAARPAGTGGRLAGDGGLADLAEVAPAAARRQRAEEGEQAADVLAARLRELSAIRAAAVWLAAGRSLATRCSPVARPRTTPRSTARGWRSTWARWCGPICRRCGGAPARRRYQPRPLNLWSVKDALQRLAALLGSLPDWTNLDQFLPETLGSPLERRAALASTLLAGLEMARGGAVRLRQETAFGPILVRRGPGGVEEGA